MIKSRILLHFLPLNQQFYVVKKDFDLSAIKAFPSLRLDESETSLDLILVDKMELRF